MTAPLFRHDQPLLKSCEAQGNRGLWFERFYDQYDPGWIVSAPAKNDWLQTHFGNKKVGDEQQLGQHSIAQASLIASLEGKTCVFKTSWHLVTGMGNPHPVENGFAWHPTLGVPYLSGAAVKGLLRSYIETHLDADQAELRQLLLHWFGSVDKDPNEVKKAEEETQAGGLIFFDALPSKPVTLTIDIMTPHLGKWYEKGGTEDAGKPEAIPADWHDPVPVPFLAAKDITLQFGFSLRHAPSAKLNPIDLDDVADALERALEQMGAGGKTTTGYGALQRDTDAEQSAEQTRIDQEKARAQAERKDQLSPEDLAHEADLELVAAFRQQYDAANKSAYQPGSNFDRERLAFMETAGAWTDARSRAAAGELLAETMTKAWGTPGKKERKQQNSSAIQTLKGEV
ncbi:MAG: type III-B CRISPR module RAMP protein Cmr6 [Halothiobacillus sp.]|jgi:CRISPR-associated protein Cmr6|nr:type III-B CRISPR module RAMP protein Cmr6 [Halothiobacillus sp.]